MRRNMRSAPRGGRAKRDGEVGSEATLGERFAGGRGRKRVEHVTESGGSRVIWYFKKNKFARQRVKG